MKVSHYRAATLAVLCSLMLAACGGHTDTSTTTTTTNDASTKARPGASVMPGSTNPNSSGATGDNMMMAPNGKPAPVPASLKCGAGDNVVWVNDRKHVYHMASDPYYGRTKHGEYMCESAAKAAGNRMAGAMHPAAGATP